MRFEQKPNPPEPTRSVELSGNLLKSFSVGFLGSFPHLQQTNRIMAPVRVVRGLGSLHKGARSLWLLLGFSFTDQVKIH